MSVLVYIENWDGKLKKISFELASYAVKLGEEMSQPVVALSLGNVEESELKKLGAYGITKILSDANDAYATLDNRAIAKAVAVAAEKQGATLVLMANNNLGKAIAPRLAVRMKAGLGTAVLGLPISITPFVIKKSVFTGKSYGFLNIKSTNKVLTLSSNSFGLVEKNADATIESFNADLTAADFETVVENTNKITGKVLLQDAEIVVSGGRGMKGPENWAPLEEMAELLGAGLACSRPVSDEGWRSHSEHVGQTGKIIAPNLYFAFGISGAIQHLGGVSGSKVIVAVNKDPDAPIFEAADYGIVGDVFKVLPQLIEAIKEMKA
ncbi:MAG: electron transfer flavoprotein subunit alpha/FixB family protein [Lentimicrobiaceae bacterium]|jgi:electron transfer flavoprotein alpha subunit|nr:electron transfer flavoprotein subunit alpha/FixB family protein [Lentimicrobiaceae bacterium]